MFTHPSSRVVVPSKDGTHAATSEDCVRRTLGTGFRRCDEEWKGAVFRAWRNVQFEEKRTPRKR
jgi:hypothetical protein